jgi:hypothetical protein
LKLQLSARQPASREDNVPGVSRVLYDDLKKFEPVKSVDKDWQASKDDLGDQWTTMQKRLTALP